VVLYRTNRDAFSLDANAARRFRSWTAPLRARSPAFGSLPKLSTRCQKIPVVDGALQVVGGTIRDGGGTIQDAGGADANAAGKSRSGAEPSRARAPAFRALSASIETSAGQFRSSAQQFRRVSREFDSLSQPFSPPAENSTRWISAVACVSGQSKCARKWTRLGEGELALLDPEANRRVLTAPVPADPHEADHVVPEVSRHVQLAVPDPLHGIGTAGLVFQGGGRGDDQ
jgi:hypothetical protein